MRVASRTYEFGAGCAPPGLYFDISNEEYHASAGLSNSGISDILQSPYHYYARHIDPARPPRRERAGQLEGTLAHCLTLEPEEFPRRYIVGPDINRNTKEWKTFAADNPGRIIIKPDQYEVALAQARNVRALPDVAQALNACAAEVSAYWIDGQHDILCRCRPDWVYDCGPPGVVLFDLKTCSDASTDEFARQIERKHYYRQAWYYSHGYAEASKRTVLAFVFIAVETEWPYMANAVMLDEAAIEQGRRECRRAMGLYAHGLKSGEWPGYPQGISEVSLRYKERGHE